MISISFIPYREFTRILDSGLQKYMKLQILGDMCRLNALSAVKRAGSGHLGSSFSAIDILVYLYFHEMNTIGIGINNQDRDIYFSSKGHDCPGHYSVLVAAGILPFEKLLALRRLGGLDGHPDIKTPGIEANSGSLGMGISKAKGMALAKNLKGNGGRIFVLTGDGELQEGQIWEALQTAVHQKINTMHLIVDNNKIQTDKPVRDVIDLGDLKRKFEAFGWQVARCNGHDFAELDNVFKKLSSIPHKPKALIADTIKGRGVSFMEGPVALRNGNGIYAWHSGAPGDDAYEMACAEIVGRINSGLNEHSLRELSLEVVEKREKGKVSFKDTAEKLVDAYGEALVELGKERKDIIVFDADLAADCGLRPFENAFPERFVENGIAEQDMVSMAGGLALQGYLPIVNSFGVFLASRANEQIYTNATEGTKIIYVCHYAGLLPAGPGKSHQSLRDISLFGNLPNCTIVEPCNSVETKAALRWFVNEAQEVCMVRLAISPCPGNIVLPRNYNFAFGKGTVLKDGKDAVIFSYGPVMVHESLLAGELLESGKFSLKVVNMPWLNRIDGSWLEEVVGYCNTIFVVDNHFPAGGLGDCVMNALISSENLRLKKIYKFAVGEYPACGAPQEILRYHGLDAKSLAARISGKIEAACERVRA